MRARAPYAPCSDATWMLVGSVAKLLDLTTEGVRQLEREGVLFCRRTLEGVRLFSGNDVMRVAAEREQARARQRHPLLATVRIRMVTATPDGARQMRFRFVPEAKPALEEPQVKRPGFRLVSRRVA